MSGVEIHANVIQSIIDGVYLQQVSPFLSAALGVMFISLLMIAYLWLSPRGALLLTITSLVTLVVITAFVFRFAMWWISPTVLFVAIVVAYPIWSWRKLEATQRYFDQELARLAAEPDVIPMADIVASAPKISLAERHMPDLITQRIESITVATERLRSLKRFVADSIESMPTAALVVDFENRVLLSNSTADRLFDTNEDAGHPSHLEGTQLLELLKRLRPSEQIVWSEVLASLQDNSRSNKPTTELMSPLTVEAKTIPPVAQEKDCVVQFAPLYAHGGVVTGLIVTVADVTPVRESERRREEALRFLSHDMRSPQASILTLLEMVRDDPASIEQSALLDKIGKYSRRTLSLADDFLRLAKAERTKPTDFQLLELTEILFDVVDEVMGDRDMLTRALINLASNAIKYSPDNTTVKIVLKLQELHWQIYVTDEGMGIAPENLSLLFQRFQRLHQEGQPKADGIGLGLVFVKTVIERMSGIVSVRSQVASKPSDTHGTTFSVQLPAVDPDA